MGNSANNIVKKTQEVFDRQVPREKAKKIAMIATVIITIIIKITHWSWWPRETTAPSQDALMHRRLT
jgi:hypothetical protein